MVPILNNLETAVACVGVSMEPFSFTLFLCPTSYPSDIIYCQNHDLDFGVAQFRHLKNQCSFPWLLANVLDPSLGEDQPLGGCEKTLILEAFNGIKVGIIGLGEREW